MPVGHAMTRESIGEWTPGSPMTFALEEDPTMFIKVDRRTIDLVINRIARKDFLPEWVSATSKERGDAVDQMLKSIRNRKVMGYVLFCCCICQCCFNVFCFGCT